VLIGALALQVVAMLVFLFAPDIGWIIGARSVQGVATGAAMSTFTAALVELAPERQKKLGATIGSTAPVGGIAIGAFLTGLAVQFVPQPTTLVFVTLALLFAADRLDHLDSVVMPALRDGSVVVSDRYLLSSLAYQSATAPEGAAVVPWIHEVNARAQRPDLTVVLDVPAEVAEARREARGGTAEVFETRALQERLVSIYARAETLVPGDRVVHVSGVGPLEAVSARVLEAVLDLEATMRPA